MSLLLSQTGYKLTLNLSDSAGSSDVCSISMTGGGIDLSESVGTIDSVTMKVKRVAVGKPIIQVEQPDFKRLYHINKLMYEDNDLLLVISEYARWD